VETTLSLRVLMLLRLRIHANRGHRPSALAAAAAAVVRERRVSVALRTQYEATGDNIAVHFADRKVIEEIPKERKAKYWGGDGVMRLASRRASTGQAGYRNGSVVML